MRVRNPFVQAVLLLAIAFSIAVVANAFASRERRLKLPGWYPNATHVPPRVPEVVPPAPVTETLAPVTATEPATLTATAAEVPAPAPTTGTTEPVPPVKSAASAPAKAPAAPPATGSASTTTAPVANPLARFAPHPDKAYVEISGADAALLHQSKVLFLDARRSSVFEEGHIAGARSFPVWESDIDDRVNELFGERSDPEQQNLPIVIYCSGGACEDSHMLAQKLWGIQFNNVYVYKDGFPDWQKRGGAVRTGGQP
jgi:rhodanese-related sulfurtransferase